MIAEFDLLGTHLVPLAAIEPTGTSFRVRMPAMFVFDDGIVCERVTSTARRS